MMDTILMFSGGIDSTYCAWKYLTDYPDKTLLLYHVRQYNREGRQAKEKEAVTNILNYFRENGLTNFEYIESGFDYGDITYLNWDIVILAIFTGTALRIPKYQGITNIIRSTCLEENNFGNPIPLAGERRRRKEEITKLSAGRENFRWPTPAIHMTKQEMLSAMPKELGALTWYCRRPTAEGTPCGRCHTCLMVSNQYHGTR